MKPIKLICILLTVVLFLPSFASTDTLSILLDGEAVDFTYENGVIHLRGLPERSPEPVLGIAVYDLDFGDAEPVYRLMPANAEEFAGV